MVLDELSKEFGVESTVNASQFFSYYPKYEYLDNLLSTCQKNKINLFVDVKGCAPALYLEWGVKTIIDYTKESRHISIHVFAAILQFIAFHKMYAAKRGIKINFHFFMEQGKSTYHTSIYSPYKSNRNLADFFGLDLAAREMFDKVMDKNYDICEYVINKIPGCHFYRLKYCEADFIPWHIMKMKFSESELCDSLNLIYSRDKDMHQCLSFPNAWQYYRGSYKDKSSMINEDNCFEHWFKVPCKRIPRIADWFPLFLAMIGDSADCIPGIKGIGPKAILKYLDEIFELYGGNPDTMYQKTMSATKVLGDSKNVISKTAEKLFSNEDILQRNMKLISYRALSEYINGDACNLYAIDVKKYIDKVFDMKDKLKSYKTLYESLDSKGLTDMIDEKTIETCFIGES